MVDKTRRRFAVTSRGGSATRWLATVLASNTSVFVAHGGFLFGSLYNEQLDSKREHDDDRSFKEGLLLNDFYSAHTLEQVYSAYEEYDKRARVHGNVHSYSFASFRAAAANEPETASNIEVVNLVRHPFSFIKSHQAIIQKARLFPDHYSQYFNGLFQQVLKDFPDLYLVECPRVDEYLAFASSCVNALAIAEELQSADVRSVKMERVTTDLASLDEVCSQLTGLQYDADVLTSSIEAGAINRHARRGTGSQSPKLLWTAWKRDVFSIVFSSHAIETIENFGYDLTIGEQLSAKQETRSKLSLAGSLEMLDPSHVLLHEMYQADRITPETIEVRDDFNIVRYAGRFFAFAKSLGRIDIPTDLPRVFQAHDRVQAFESRDIEAVRAFVDERERLGVNAVPQLIETLRDYNIVRFGTKYLALAHSLGAISIPVDLPETLKIHGGVKAFQGASVSAARAFINEKTHRRHPK